MRPTEKNDETDDLRLNLLTQEIKFARMLAGNTFDGAIKEKHIDRLSAWLRNRAACTAAFTDKDCLRIWKGLFYSMWMSDKPLPQENLATKIAGLMHSFDQIEKSFQFFAAFLKTMANEWNGIDQWRIDKFMMLVRKVTREVIRIVQQNDWNEVVIEQLNETLKNTILCNDNVPPRGLFMHFTELFFEEVAKISEGDIEPEHVTKLLQPFMYYVASHGDYKLIQFVVRNVFNYLLFQSESGREYKEKFDAWKSMNFPGKSINELVLEQPDDEQTTNGNDAGAMNGSRDSSDNEESDEDESANTSSTKNKALDPRAGRVDVVMPEIKFDPNGIVEKLENLKYQKFTRTRNRKCIDRIVTTYKKFATGVFPIGIQRIKVDRDEIQLPDVEEKAADLLEFENELYGKQRALKKLTKRKRRRIVSDGKLFDEFQANAEKVAKIKHQANTWIEEDIPIEENVVDEAPPIKKKKKMNKDRMNSSTVGMNNKSNSMVVQDDDDNHAEQKHTKKHKNSEWDEPLDDGEVEYFIPSKKQQMNGVPHITKTPESTSVHVITPSKSNKSKVNGVTENNENSTPQIKRVKPKVLTPATNSEHKISSPKVSSEKKVKSTSMLAHSKTSTPNIFVEKASAATTPSSSTMSVEKRVKIALTMNRSQEVVEYMRQIKHSPHLPYDSAKKPSKGVLKPNLAPSPINPFYKKLIGLDK